VVELALDDAGRGGAVFISGQEQVILSRRTRVPLLDARIDRYGRLHCRGGSVAGLAFAYVEQQGLRFFAEANVTVLEGVEL
jgi:hypothetical protein